MRLPRLLVGALHRAPSQAEHEAMHGPPPSGGAPLGEAVDAAGLRGRGGAGFPTAVKLAAVAGRRGPRSLLVNGAEGEPMSAKDRLIMRLAPQLVLDGALAAAATVGAQRIVIAVRENAADALDAMHAAAADRAPDVEIELVELPVAYLAGEESALIALLDGGPLKPTSVPPRPFQRGLRGRPTLVLNPETLAHVALIGRHGPSWFRELGSVRLPGSMLLTVSGAVSSPGIMEIECGSPLEHVLAAAGGPAEPLRAVLVGGYHGVWISEAEIAAAALDDEGLAAFGGVVGAGVVVALPRAACPVMELAGTMRWLADQSAHQCGPCRNGLPAIAAALEAMAAGRADPATWERLRRWSASLPGRGACRLPDGAIRFLASGLRVFAPELADHQRHGPCDACRRPGTLATPTLAAGAAR